MCGKTHDEQGDTITQSQLPNCKEMWTLLARQQEGKAFLKFPTSVPHLQKPWQVSWRRSPNALAGLCVPLSSLSCGCKAGVKCWDETCWPAAPHITDIPFAWVYAQTGEPAQGKKSSLTASVQSKEKSDKDKGDAGAPDTAKLAFLLTREFVFSHTVISESSQEEKSGC